MTSSSCALSYKVIVKKVNFHLQKNFFSLGEFKTLPFRKAVRVVKLIGKINGYRLRRSEAKDIAFEIQNLNKKVPQIISKFFNWSHTFICKTKKNLFSYITASFFISLVFHNKHQILRC